MGNHGTKLSGLLVRGTFKGHVIEPFPAQGILGKMFSQVFIRQRSIRHSQRFPQGVVLSGLAH